MRATRQRFGEVLLLAMGAVLAVLSAEVCVRVLLGEQLKYRFHHVGATFGVRINEPNARYTHRSADLEVEFRINGQGMRASREYALARVDGVGRILVLGDSFAFGLEVAEEETFASVLERELHRGRPVEVLNAGVSGFGNAEACVYLERELVRYEPDLVVLSFFGNDLVDNVRSDLFRLDGDRLVEGAPRYVPGAWERWLYETAPSSSLLERSEALAFARERVARLILRRWLGAEVEDVASAEGDPARRMGDVVHRRRLAAAILDRIYSVLRERGIPLVILSIPTELREPPRLVDLFPAEDFDVRREGVWFLSAKAVLDPWLGRELLYWERSQRHWTPFSHRVTGEALARLIAVEGVLDAAPGAHGGPRAAQARALPQDAGRPSNDRLR